MPFAPCLALLIGLGLSMLARAAREIQAEPIPGFARLCLSLACSNARGDSRRIVMAKDVPVRLWRVRQGMNVLFRFVTSCLAFSK
ncbi:hypothetical protein [Paracoccus sp. T5]|uniref:hypothetical protein n=1 Tax=Paracoccus sp. T5 TaxID=3402161 RepID=UPI003AED30D2